MRIVVTGGLGFIGSHTVRLLLDAGHDVVVVDNCIVGHPQALAPHPHLQVWPLDIQGEVRFDTLPGPPDVVIHLAAMTRLQASLERPTACLSHNVIGTSRILSAAKACGVPRIVFASSSSVYGLTPAPHTERGPTDPLNPYALSKLTGEILMRQSTTQHRMTTVCLRYFNVYGPGENDAGDYTTVVRCFHRRHSAGQPLLVFGDGEQRRDFTHVSDVARANVLAATVELTGHHVLNIGYGENRSVNQVSSLFGGVREYLPAKLAEARETLADRRLAQAVLGWDPRLTLEAGVEDLKAGTVEGKR